MWGRRRSSVLLSRHGPARGHPATCRGRHGRFRAAPWPAKLGASHPVPGGRHGREGRPLRDPDRRQRARRRVLLRRVRLEPRTVRSRGVLDHERRRRRGHRRRVDEAVARQQRPDVLHRGRRHRRRARGHREGRRITADGTHADPDRRVVGLLPGHRGQQGRHLPARPERPDARGRAVGLSMTPEGADGARAGVSFTHLDDGLFAGAGATKRDLVEYLYAISDRILPALRERPLSVIRVNRGQDAFMQKTLPKYTPDWVRTVRVWAEASKRDVTYALCNDRRTLLWFANQRAIEYHPA